MAKENTSSQSQQSGVPGWADGVARLEAFAEQMTAWEQQAIARATEAAAQGAELARTGLDYAARLSEAWRNMALDAIRQGPRA